MKIIRDSKALTDMTEDVDTRLSEDQKAAARRVIAGWVADRHPHDELADQVLIAEDLMRYLGVHPLQTDIETYHTRLMAPLPSLVQP